MIPNIKFDNKTIFYSSSSHISLQSVDLAGTPPVRSRSSSIHSSDSLRNFTAGVLNLEVHSAKNLEKKGMFGKADPYVLVTFGANKSRSKTINNNQVNTFIIWENYSPLVLKWYKV